MASEPALAARAALLAAICAVACSGCAIPIIGAPAYETTKAQGLAETPLARSASESGPKGAALTSAAPRACYSQLTAAHVAFERVEHEQALGVQMPARLLGPIGGITVNASDATRLHAILDCRLALALLSWAPTLQRAGVSGIDHYSMYRPSARIRGSRQVSGHARGLAIDAARFHLRNGAVVDVLTDWQERDRGGAPCPRRPEEAWPSRLLRSMVCEAVDRNLFQVVITPHHDRAHRNHVHLELKPEVSWTYVR